MAKAKDTKYKEAVSRNIKNAGKYRQIAQETGTKLTDTQLKIKIGIRKGDISYDKELNVKE